LIGNLKVSDTIEIEDNKGWNVNKIKSIKSNLVRSNFCD